MPAYLKIGDVIEYDGRPECVVLRVFEAINDNNQCRCIVNLCDKNTMTFYTAVTINLLLRG